LSTSTWAALCSSRVTTAARPAAKERFSLGGGRIQHEDRVGLLDAGEVEEVEVVAHPLAAHVLRRDEDDGLAVGFHQEGPSRGDLGREGDGLDRRRAPRPPGLSLSLDLRLRLVMCLVLCLPGLEDVE
jgi:hypothetical protein